MKKYLLLLPLVLGGCQGNEPVAEEEFEVQTLGRNSDCGQPMVEVLGDPARLAAVVGTSGTWARYIAYNLDTALWQSKSQRLLIKVRKPLSTEVGVCKAFGPSYPWLTVVRARRK